MNRPADRCPGVFSAHPAADGHLARIRLPGGRLTPDHLQSLAEVADVYGDAHLELTSRGNVQIRGIDDLDGAGNRIVEAGLIPTPSHERVRNLQLSALSGRRGGLVDLRATLVDLDIGLRGDPALAALPARFLFGVDDGRGDVLAQRPDSGILALSDDRAEVVVAGTGSGRTVSLGAAVELMLALAGAFLSDRTDEWRVEDLADRPAIDAVLDALERVAPRPASHPAAEPLIGWLPQDDGLVTLGAVAPHGRLAARTAEFLAAIGTDIYLTPNKEILVCDLSEDVADTALRVLAPMGLVFDANSPWAMVSACTGSPGCAKAHANVRAELELRLQEPVEAREHWVGCDRGCGSPHTEHVQVRATAGGFERRTVPGVPLS
ncbi:precorrin-3B synthase [Aldersonia sp. NBC_00410]|uniref:precorrin-3B synthase n=1 Tax=Aldersonia sp. NBC_00410 TaxID=2975954 RepID=UPI002258033F|nr:precorrin-3B synthase [Aldersonia sp. NBC_00410]MCX5045812.1 precorrin-3B synthase [Aldersonia sp. NBC_00410]